MLKIFKTIGYFLERFERNFPRIFWPCIAVLGFFLLHEVEPGSASSRFPLVIEQVHGRGGGGNSESNSNAAFRATPPVSGSSEKELSKSQNLKPKLINEPTPRVGSKIALSGGKKLPDNPSGGGSWGLDNQDNELAWGKIQRDLNKLIEQMRLGNKSPGTGIKTFFKDIIV
jgi:hypothetical protein